MKVGVRFLAQDLTADGPAPASASSDTVARRLGELEARLIAIDVHSGDYVDAVIAGQTAELGLIQERLRQRAEPKLPSADDIRHEVQGWVNSTLNARLAEMEARLRDENEQKQQAVLDVFIESLQTRVVQRIAKLEADVTSQGIALTGLHDYSLQTERNMQKLLAGVERLIAGQPSAPAAPTESQVLSVPAPAPPVSAEVVPSDGIETTPPAAVVETPRNNLPEPSRGLFAKWFR